MTHLAAFAWANAVIVGAALFRLRGSSSFAEWTGRGATTARLCWASYLTAAAMALGDFGGALAGLLLSAIWLGSLPGWWQSLGVRDWREVARHSARGLVWTAPPAGVVVLLGGNAAWLLLAGLACGPLYWLARRVNPERATQGGEWAFGAAYALALLIGIAES